MKKSRAIECGEKRTYWEEMVSRWETSGLSQIEFSRRNDLNSHRFNYWKRRVKKCTMSIPLVQLGGLPALSEKYLPDASKLGLSIDGRFRIEICDGFFPMRQLQPIIRQLRLLYLMDSAEKLHIVPGFRRNDGYFPVKSISLG